MLYNVLLEMAKRQTLWRIEGMDEPVIVTSTLQPILKKQLSQFTGMPVDFTLPRSQWRNFMQSLEMPI